MAIHASSAATSLPYCTHRLDSTTVAASISNSTHSCTTNEPVAERTPTDEPNPAPRCDQQPLLRGQNS